MERKLAAILAADVVGYSAMMADDEEAALADLKEHRETVFDPILATYSGRIIKLIGDGTLVEFPSAVDAVQFGLDVQRELANQSSRLQLRIGIHLGDVILEDDDIYGHGVNIAARLETLSPVGGICISSIVYECIGRRIADFFSDMGQNTLKNMSNSIRLYAWQPKEEITAPPVRQEREKPSVAVLPFVNMSEDEDQQYFSDGISEDIITGLSRFRTLLVVARSSSFKFRQSDLSDSEIAAKLGVQYLVEGSVRKAGNRVRISTQLIAADTGNHLWAERYDRNLEDIFNVQDEVTQNIIAVLPGRVQHDVAERSTLKPTENMKAYELLLKGKALRDGLNPQDTARAKQYFEKALKLDPTYARAYMYLADTYVVDMWLGLADPDAPKHALDIARKGAALDNNDVYIQDQLGYAYLCAQLWGHADVQFEKTLSRIVNEAESMAWCGYGFLLLSRHEKAYDVVIEAMRLDPLHPPALDWILGQVYFFLGRYDDAVGKLIGEAHLNSIADAFLVAAFAHSERQSEAEAALETFVQRRRAELESRGISAGANTISELAGGFRATWRNPDDWVLLASGLRRAGLPD
ncbi:adenylate/guanylate cyclase domain-containing protein [Sulfitobacter sp. SK012]|uniref:adenylate/guanylate cyclase domain-containing protein n=1 Tax=Sulfitobacter sp. SK012 TaxID=1389005 RepID=UPI000E0AF28C|nr:adenylate/guanylate cyclase domain-containing protein [Sulfitobacter sp. SK012]AXI48217.1 adenylate/guanylate cyclase domain-containing protein [Sulfitobacter sp. SK012]